MVAGENTEQQNRQAAANAAMSLIGIIPGFDNLGDEAKPMVGKVVDFVSQKLNINVSALSAGARAAVGLGVIAAGVAVALTGAGLPAAIPLFIIGAKLIGKGLLEFFKGLFGSKKENAADNAVDADPQALNPIEQLADTLAIDPNILNNLGGIKDVDLNEVLQHLLSLNDITAEDLESALEVAMSGDKVDDIAKLCGIQPNEVQDMLKQAKKSLTQAQQSSATQDPDSGVAHFHNLKAQLEEAKKDGDPEPPTSPGTP